MNELLKIGIKLREVLRTFFMSLPIMYSCFRGL